MPDNPNTGTFLPPEATKDDGDGRKYILLPNGTKFYTLPQAGSPLYFQGSNGGIAHNPDKWNPITGKWEPGGVNWAKVGIMLGGIAIGGYAGAVAAANTGAVGAGTAAASSGGAAAGGGTAAGAGTAGAGGTLAASSTVPSTGALATGGVASGAVPAASAAGGGSTVAGTGTVEWVRLDGRVSPVISGSQVVGGILQYKAGNKATDAQAKAAEEALQFLKERDARNYADLATYRNAGQAATLKGMALQGLSAPPLNPTPMATNPNSIPAGQPFPASWVPGNPINAGKGATMSALMNGQTPGDASFAVVQTPNGQRVRVPHGELADAIAHGGQVLS